jgi:hypothetical protein
VTQGGTRWEGLKPTEMAESNGQQNEYFSTKKVKITVIVESNRGALIIAVFINM